MIAVTSAPATGALAASRTQASRLPGPDVLRVHALPVKRRVSQPVVGVQLDLALVVRQLVLLLGAGRPSDPR